LQYTAVLCNTSQTHRKHANTRQHANTPQTHRKQATNSLAATHCNALQIGACLFAKKKLQKKRMAGIFATETNHFEDVLCYTLFLLKNNFPSLYLNSS